jgi:ribosomal-protein-alanine N-acetyltransferase
MLRTDFTPFPALDTPRLHLRAVTRHDADAIYFLRSDPTVLAYLNIPPAQSVADAEVFIDMISGLQQKGEGITWGMARHGEPELIGTICYWNLKPEADQAELGYMLRPEFHGRGFMQETLTTVLRYGAEVMGLRTIEACTHPENEPSKRLLERHGFIESGRLGAENLLLYILKT